jgi:hypothetical protein
VILIEGTVRESHPRSASNCTGRPVLSGTAGVCRAVLAEVTLAGLRPQSMFDCATAPIHSQLPSPGFVF